MKYAKVFKSGLHSLGIIIPIEIVKTHDLSPGDYLSIEQLKVIKAKDMHRHKIEQKEKELNLLLSSLSSK
jgi:hypothetical protein